MAIKINGDNSVANPGFTGDDTDTGLQVGTNELKLVTGGTARATVDSSGNVGIGTTSPASFLHIDSNNTYGSVVLSRDGGASGRRPFGIGISGSSDDHLRISVSSDTTGTNAFANQLIEITSEGNVGIGTTSPSDYGNFADDLVIFNSTQPGITLATGTTGVGSIYFADGTVGVAAARGQIQYDHSDDSLLFATAASEALRIDSSRRLLVGTSSAIGAGNDLVVLKGTAVADASIYLGRNANASSISNGNNLGFIKFGGGDGGEAARISGIADGTWSSTSDCPGRLVFSTTADGASSPTERMRIGSTGTIQTYASSSTDSLFLSNSTSAGTSVILLGGRHSATSTTTGTLSFRVYTNGNVQNTNNSYGSLSDVKLKENIVDASSQWDDIKDLRVRNYNFIEGQTHTQIGVVAQEVETVSPGLVTESPDRDEEGNDLGTTTKSVNYSVLYMKAVKALQEAMDRIETLETQNADLTARITALESA